MSKAGETKTHVARAHTQVPGVNGRPKRIEASEALYLSRSKLGAHGMDQIELARDIRAH